MKNKNIQIQSNKGENILIFNEDIFYTNDIITISLLNNKKLFGKIKDIRKYCSNNKRDESDCIVLHIFDENKDFIIYPYKDNIDEMILEKEITKKYISQLNILYQKHDKEKIISYVKTKNPLFTLKCITSNDMNIIKRKFK